MDNFIQFMILFLSGLSIWLATGNTRRKKITGSIVGIVAQTFWLIDTVRHGQWGMVILSIWYFFIFLRILYNESNT